MSTDRSDAGPEFSSYVVRPMREDDRDAVLALMRESLGEGPMGRSPKVWTWKHRASPFGPSPGLIAEADGEIVALRLFLPWRWTASGRTVRAVRAVDTATRTDYRGQGIFRRLTTDLVEQVEGEGYDWIFNTPNSKSRPGYLKMGWATVGRLRLYARPTRRAFTSRRGSMPPSEVAIGSSLDDLLLEPRLEEILRSFAAADETRWSTPRTLDYLRWRYADAPRLGYRAAWSLDGDGGAAVIFRMRRRSGLWEASLAEVLLTPGRAGVRRARKVIAEIARGPVDILTAAAASKTPERRALAGFLPLIVPTRHFTFRPLGEIPKPDPRRWSSWRFSLGDLEVF